VENDDEDDEMSNLCVFELIYLYLYYISAILIGSDAD